MADTVCFSVVGVQLVWKQTSWPKRCVLCGGIQQKCCGLSVPAPVCTTGQSVQIWHLWLWSSDLSFAQLNWLEAVQCSQTQAGWGTGERGCDYPWAVQSSPVINHTSADRFHGWSWVAAQSPGCNICSLFPLGKLTREFSDISVGMDTHMDAYLEGSEKESGSDSTFYSPNAPTFVKSELQQFWIPVKWIEEGNGFI